MSFSRVCIAHMPKFKAGIVDKNLSTVQVGPLGRIELTPSRCRNSAMISKSTYSAFKGTSICQPQKSFDRYFF